MDVKQKIKKLYMEDLFFHPENKISITELCQKAGINRATFYKHFNSVADLKYQTVQAFFNNVAKTIVGEQNIYTVDGMYAVFYRYFEFSIHYRNYIKTDVMKQEFRYYMSIFCQELVKHLSQKLPLSDSLQQTEEMEHFLFYIPSVFGIWSYIFVFLTESEYKLMEDNSLWIKIQNENISEFNNFETAPYKLVQPDKLDLFVATVNHAVFEGGRFHYVAELCRYAGINRQAFYRQFKDLDDFFNQINTFLEKYSAYWLIRNVYHTSCSEIIFPLYLPSAVRFDKTDSFFLFMVNTDILLPILRGFYSAYSFGMNALRENRKNSTDNKRDVFLFYYFCMFLITYGNYFCVKDKKLLQKRLAYMEKFCKSIPGLLEALNQIQQTIINEEMNE